MSTAIELLGTAIVSPPLDSLAPRRGEISPVGYCTTACPHTIHAKVERPETPNPLRRNILAIGDWIRAGRIEKNLFPGHLAKKMGIATTLVRAWEAGAEEPDPKHLEIMATILGKPIKGQRIMSSRV
jgi:DNA-binding transcriptional regulator YiaG